MRATGRVTRRIVSDQRWLYLETGQIWTGYQVAIAFHGRYRIDFGQCLTKKLLASSVHEILFGYCGGPLFRRTR